MAAFDLHGIIFLIQRFVSGVGVFIILVGVLFALYQYGCHVARGKITSNSAGLNVIRLDLGRTLILGLEFIVAADLIGTTSAPDYYTVGMLAIIVVVRTILSFSISRELMMIKKN